MTWECWWESGMTFQMGSIQERGSAVGISYVSGQKVAPSSTASVGSLLLLHAQVGAQFGALVWMFVDSDFRWLLWNSPFLQILIPPFMVFIWMFMFHLSSHTVLIFLLHLFSSQLHPPFFLHLRFIETPSLDSDLTTQQISTQCYYVMSLLLVFDDRFYFKHTFSSDGVMTCGSPPSSSVPCSGHPMPSGY